MKLPGVQDRAWERLALIWDCQVRARQESDDEIIINHFSTMQIIYFSTKIHQGKWYLVVLSVIVSFPDLPYFLLFSLRQSEVKQAWEQG